MRSQRTIYCGRSHRLLDGAPVGHPCRILDPAYLHAERMEEYGRAVEILERMPLFLHPGLCEGNATTERDGQPAISEHRAEGAASRRNLDSATGAA